MSDSLRSFDNSDRTRLLLKGPDRAKFLHNLTTNEVKRLKSGEGREAFVTSPQGKTLAMIQYHVLPDSILIRLDAACRTDCVGHFGKYGVFDDVEVEEVTKTHGEWVVTGADVSTTLSDWFETIPESAQGIVSDRESAWIINDDPTGGGGFTLVAPMEWFAVRREKLGDLIPVDEYEALRITAGTPEFGADVLPSNLPQEIGRDVLAINFVKGCYLGQETVARLDALGHVNKLLLGMETAPGGPIPPPGAVVTKDGVEVGTVTSSAQSRARGTSVGLAVLKVPKVAVGDRLLAQWEGGTASVKVQPLPFLPSDV